MLTSITGKTVVVTGGSKGIGKGIAEVFARQQTNVLVVSRHLDEAQAVAESIGPQAAGFACDVSDWDACQALAAEAERVFGGLDILCLNAGIFPQQQQQQQEETRVINWPRSTHGRG